MKPIEILFEDNHLLIVNKPAGILSQGDDTGDLTILDIGKKYIKDRYNKPGEVFLGCVHRLDRPVSGIIVMARTSKALSRLNQQFKSKLVEKTYWAVVNNKPKPESGRLTHFLIKDQTKNVTKAYSKPKGNSKEAILNYQLLKVIGGDYFMEVKPVTGRPHQIRVQLASLGCPINGDLKYGSKIRQEDGNIMLHAHQITFEHPVKKEKITINCPPPGSWEKH